MMDTKERHYSPLMQVSLEVEGSGESLLSPFGANPRPVGCRARRVQETYAGKGRPSIDPLVYFKLQLVMLFVVMCFGLALCDSSHFFEVRWTH